MARSTTQRDSLSTKDHFDVCESLKILKDKELVKLGTALGLLYSNLDRMKNLPDDLVDAWLKEMDNVEEKSGSPSWTSLISALESIGQGGVASTIKKGLSPPTIVVDTPSPAFSSSEGITSMTITASSLEPSSSLSTRSSTNSSERTLRNVASPITSPSNLEEKIQSLEDHFNEIVLQTFDKVKERKLDVSQFRARLVTVPIKYREHHKEFFLKLENDIKKDESIDHIWMKLSCYWDFLNYTLLENLVQKFEDHKLKANMKDYVKRLKEFRSTTRVCDFAEYCTKVNKQLKRHHLKDIVFKFNQSWEECTLEDLESMKESISHKFFLPSFVISIKDIQPGSIIVTWTLPTVIASAIMEILETTYVSELCNENGIESITIDGKEIIYSSIKDYEAYEAFLKDINFTMMEKYRCGDVHVRASGSVIVRSTSSWTPLDYYSLGYTLANSPSEWKLHFFSFGDEVIKEMCRGMLKCMKPSESGKDIHAHFRGNISVEGLKQFVKVPHHLLQRIVTLDFSSNKLDKKALDLLSQVIPALSRLEVLNISNNPIGEGGAVELMRALSHYKTPLKELLLNGTSLGEEDIQALCEILADNLIELLDINGPIISIMRLHVQTIRVKILRVCRPMSVDSCTSLASLLKHRMCQLKELDIRAYSINSDGAVQLATALSENKSVVKVNMRWNEDFGDVGAGAFGGMLRRNTVLRELELSYCGITSQGCDRLAGGVRANSTLQVLDLSDNQIEENGVDLMLTSLQNNMSLKILLLPRIYKRRQADPRVEWRGLPLPSFSGFDSSRSSSSGYSSSRSSSSGYGSSRASSSGYGSSRSSYSDYGSSSSGYGASQSSSGYSSSPRKLHRTSPDKHGISPLVSSHSLEPPQPLPHSKLQSTYHAIKHMMPQPAKTPEAPKSKLESSKEESEDWPWPLKVLSPPLPLKESEDWVQLGESEDWTLSVPSPPLHSPKEEQSLSPTSSPPPLKDWSLSPASSPPLQEHPLKEDWSPSATTSPHLLKENRSDSL